VNRFDARAAIAERKSPAAPPELIKCSKAQAWSDCTEPVDPKLQRVLMDNFPSFEVFSRYTKSLLPTSCQQLQLLFFKQQHP
jgi:hypothetical protein